MPKSPARQPEYSPEEEADLARHEDLPNFEAECGVRPCTICGQMAADFPAEDDQPEGDA